MPPQSDSPLRILTQEISACEICAAELPLGPGPLFRVSGDARLLIIGQAPGRRAHEKGVPWDDPSGDRLREWLGIDRETFDSAPEIALMPMGFCYPGTGIGGDLPPRAECASTWHERLLEQMPRVSTTLLIGSYALKAYLPTRYGSLTEAVKHWRSHFPSRLPLPHPSPRNNRWLARNRWFEGEVLPALRSEVARYLSR